MVYYSYIYITYVLIIINKKFDFQVLHFTHTPKSTIEDAFLTELHSMMFCCSQITEQVHVQYHSLMITH